MYLGSTLSGFLLLSIVGSIPVPDPIPDDQSAAVQHRLAFAGENGMAISWNTFKFVDKPLVRYGVAPDKLVYSAVGVSSTYPTSSTWNNHVKLSGLSPNTIYYYQVSSDSRGSVNEVYNFTSAPKVGSRSDFSFAVAIDMGTMGPLGLSETTGQGAGGVLLPGEQNTIDSLTQSLDQFEFLWHPGDIAYADYWLKEEIQGYLPETTLEQGIEVYESILNAFYQQIQGVSAFKPYMVGPGNHEANCNNGKTHDKKKGITYSSVDICMPGQTNFTGLINHFRMPNSESGGKNNMWYSFDYGMVHFIQFNTETDLGNGLIGPDEPKGKSEENAGPFGSYDNEQIDWLKNDLKSVDRSKTPWLIVAGHRPWYASAKKKSICKECQEAFEDLFIENKVDVAIFGHVHNYQRLHPIACNKLDPNGLKNPSAPWYILNGAAGHYDGMDALKYPSKDHFAYGFDNTYGWSKFTIHNETHLTHEFIASRNNTVMDTATLYKNRL